VRTYDLLLWLVRATLKFPRSQRFVLARTVQWTVLQFHERLIEAALLSKRDPAAAFDRLNQADVLLVKLRFYLRLCHDLALLSDGQYAHVSGMVDEVGRLLGAWIKKARPAAHGRPAQGELQDVTLSSAWQALI
jgi:hypothetical protein